MSLQISDVAGQKNLGHVRFPGVGASVLENVILGLVTTNGDATARLTKECFDGEQTCCTVTRLFLSYYGFKRHTPQAGHEKNVDKSFPPYRKNTTAKKVSLLK